jgi:hypothetical protein
MKFNKGDKVIVTNFDSPEVFKIRNLNLLKGTVQDYDGQHVIIQAGMACYKVEQHECFREEFENELRSLVEMRRNLTELAKITLEAHISIINRNQGDQS